MGLNSYYIEIKLNANIEELNQRQFYWNLFIIHTIKLILC